MPTNMDRERATITIDRGMMQMIVTSVVMKIRHIPSAEGMGTPTTNPTLRTLYQHAAKETLKTEREFFKMQEQIHKKT